MAATVLAGGAPPDRAAAATSEPVVVRVSGNHLVDADGRVVVLRGVDRSGMEYACSQGWGMADGPMDQASVDAMARWGVNAVRLPLNEDCWLGINGVPAEYAGARYRAAVSAYVAELHRDGMVAILDLHWSAPGARLADGQADMADADHSPAFWASVASAYRRDPGVIFDLYNEPHDVSWQCWRDGCATPGFRTAGMQSLLDAVRGAGADQPVMLGSIGWAGAPGGPDQYGADPTSGWLRWRPYDPVGQEVMSWHNYRFAGQTTGCLAVGCFREEVGPVATRFPVVTGEFGETDCATAYVADLMGWADATGVSYLAWGWQASDDRCGDHGPSLVTDYAGDPTVTGAAIRSHFLTMTTAAAPSPSAPSPPPTTPSPTPAPPVRALTLHLSTVGVWPGGAQLQLTATNDARSAVSDLISARFAGAVEVTDSWGGTVAAAGTGAEISLPAWDPTVAPGATARLGFLVAGAPPRLVSCGATVACRVR